ncbi:MAG TPA: hypothetical protein VN894_07535 [Polyangiaceae bacterium]|nr:hypothetical protein [Polyangiaceae bacterium]
MKLRFLFGLLTPSLAFLALAPSARAQGDRPILVEYSAPTPECASSEAFQTRLRAEMAPSSDVEHAWRFALRIRRIPDGRYEGTLTTETGVRQVTASRCDEVTASLAVIIAMAERSVDVPAPSTPPPAPAPTPLAPAAVPAPASPAPRAESPPATDRKLDSSDNASPAKWRVGARGFATNHPSWGTPNPGLMGFASVEVPWGFHAMMFEGGIGASFAHGSTPPEFGPARLVPTSVQSNLTFVIVDTEACLLDVPIGESGFSVLGCLRVAGGTFSGSVYPSIGLVLWGGLGTRLRWQSPTRLFLEVNFDAMYGTISDAADDSPGWFEGGASLGVQL